MLPCNPTGPHSQHASLTRTHPFAVQHDHREHTHAPLPCPHLRQHSYNPPCFRTWLPCSMTTASACVLFTSCPSKTNSCWPQPGGSGPRKRLPAREKKSCVRSGWRVENSVQWCWLPRARLGCIPHRAGAALTASMCVHNSTGTQKGSGVEGQRHATQYPQANEPTR